MTVTIRDAHAEDKARCLILLDSLAAFAGSTIHADAGAVFDRLLDHDRGRIIVAEDSGEIIGLAAVSYNLAMRYGGEYCQLEELIVDPAGRGKNIGGRLVAATVDHARERGCREYGLYLVEATEQNQPFYEKYGFVRVGSEMRQPL